jgi:SAM-dependent methyltransferase
MAAHLATVFRPERVLDVGCGMAFLVKWLRNYGVQAYGCDHSQFAVEHAADPRYLAPGGLDVRGYLQRASAECLPYADSSYDLVCCLDLLEHLPVPNAIQAIQELERVTSRYLFLIITVHDDPNPDLILPKGAKGDPTHVTVASETFWRRQMADHTRLVQRRDLEEGARRDLGRILPWTFFIYQKATHDETADREQRPEAL